MCFYFSVLKNEEQRLRWMKLTELVVCEASLGIFFYGLEDTAQFALNDKITQLWKEVGLLNTASSAE